jgi:hypothetical protein
MPRIRSQQPQGRLTSQSEPEPNNLIPSSTGSLRGLAARGSRAGGLAQDGVRPSAFQRIKGVYQENRAQFNIAGAAIGGFVLGMLVSSK